MTYENMLPGIFLSRPNRFIAHVEAEGETRVCHVKNTGRLGELLLPGARVYVQRAQNPARKTAYDLISVYKGERLVNIDSGAPNKVFAEWVVQSGAFSAPGEALSLRPEARYGESRLDFYLEAAGRGTYVEVKGVTLEADGAALFPDAPTQRGVRHLEELVRCKQAGFGAAAVFVIQLAGTHRFSPNDATHPAFGQALRAARAAGVQVLALECAVAPDSLTVFGAVPVAL